MKIKKYLNTTSILFIICVVYTLLVKFVDVASIGPNGSKVGFSTINEAVHNMFPYNDFWYQVSKYIGYLPFLLVAFYGCMGIYQFIKKKDLLKVDKQLLALGIFYFMVAATYIFFEKVIINYRPVLMDGVLEASFPSSHTMLAICICASSMFISRNYIKNEKLNNCLTIISGIVMVVLVVGRTLSGVHWFTDILGGILISSFLVSIFYSAVRKKRIKR